MKRHMPFLLLALLLAMMTFAVGAGHAAPAAQGTNLLQNPGFEQPYSGGAAQNWQKWNLSTEKQDEACLVAYHYLPKWNVETGGTFVRDGAASQYIGNNWDTWAGGVYQTVPATPGTTYRFTFFGRARGSNEPSPAPSEGGLQVNMRAGIDPNGSGAWNDADVVWGAAGSPHDQWQQFTVEATATGNQVTVFTSANWGVTGVNQCRQFIDTWYDAAQLVAQTPPTNTPAPQVTQAPATATVPPAPTGVIPTEAAAATLEATLQPTATADPSLSSAICANAFLDANANGVRDADEGYVVGVTIIAGQGSVVVGQGVTNGTDTPLCFRDLAAGVYQVGQVLPSGLEMTTQANATIALAEGQTIGLEFGSRPRTGPPTADPNASPTAATAATATTTPQPAPDDNGGPDWLVIIGLGAILVGVALLGALLFVLLRR